MSRLCDVKSPSSQNCKMAALSQWDSHDLGDKVRPARAGKAVQARDEQGAIQASCKPSSHRPEPSSDPSGLAKKQSPEALEPAVAASKSSRAPLVPRHVAPGKSSQQPKPCMDQKHQKSHKDSVDRPRKDTPAPREPNLASTGSLDATEATASREVRRGTQKVSDEPVMASGSRKDTPPTPGVKADASGSKAKQQKAAAAAASAAADRSASNSKQAAAQPTADGSTPRAKAEGVHSRSHIHAASVQAQPVMDANVSSSQSQQVPSKREASADPTTHPPSMDLNGPVTDVQGHRLPARLSVGVPNHSTPDPIWSQDHTSSAGLALVPRASRDKEAGPAAARPREGLQEARNGPAKAASASVAAAHSSRPAAGPTAASAPSTVDGSKQGQQTSAKPKEGEPLSSQAPPTQSHPQPELPKSDRSSVKDRLSRPEAPGLAGSGRARREQADGRAASQQPVVVGEVEPGSAEAREEAARRKERKPIQWTGRVETGMLSSLLMMPVHTVMHVRPFVACQHSKAAGSGVCRLPLMTAASPWCFRCRCSGLGLTGHRCCAKLEGGRGCPTPRLLPQCIYCDCTMLCHSVWLKLS